MNEEREINLIDLVADILSHWRGLLIFMAAGAVLMGAFSYVRSYRAAGQVQDEAGEGGLSEKGIELADFEDLSREERLEELEDLLKESEKLSVMAVLDDEQENAIHQQYVEKSILMKMDPYSIPKTELIFGIRMEDMGESYMLRSVYEDLINGVGMLQWVEDKTGIPAVSADELISALAKSNVVVLNGDREAEPGNDCLKVTVAHYDAAECKKLAQCVKDYINEQHEQLARELGAHEVTLLSESSSVVMDTTVRDRQISYSNSRLSFLINGANTRAGFTKAQEMYYDLLSGGDGILSEDEEEEDGTEDKDEIVQKPSVSKKYIVLGAFLFVFLYAGVLFVIYIMNGKLRTSDELQRLFNISQLGLVVKEDGKKRFIVDRWIDALRNRGKRRFTREQSLELAAAAVKISAQKQELDTVCLMGCDLKAGADAVCQALKERLGREKLDVTILDNVLYDAEALEKLGESQGRSQGIVLVEKAMSTLCEEIARELELAERQGIRVLGGIVVE